MSRRTNYTSPAKTLGKMDELNPRDYVQNRDPETDYPNTIIGVLEHQSKEIQELAEAVNKLIEKLAPIIRPVPSFGHGGSPAKEESSGSQLAELFSQNSSTISMILDKVVSVTRDIDL